MIPPSQLAAAKLEAKTGHSGLSVSGDPESNRLYHDGTFSAKGF
jgi:hypothetical protein